MSEVAVDVGAVFFALADDTRRTLVERLVRGAATATELARELPLTRQGIAKHLAVLRCAGLVGDRRCGRETCYCLMPAPMGEAMAWMAAVGGRWDERLEVLSSYLVTEQGQSAGR